MSLLRVFIGLLAAAALSLIALPAHAAAYVGDVEYLGYDYGTSATATVRFNFDAPDQYGQWAGNFTLDGSPVTLTRDPSNDYEASLAGVAPGTHTFVAVAPNMTREQITFTVSKKGSTSSVLSQHVSNTCGSGATHFLWKQRVTGTTKYQVTVRDTRVAQNVKYATFTLTDNTEYGSADLLLSAGRSYKIDVRTSNGTVLTTGLTVRSAC